MDILNYLFCRGYNLKKVTATEYSGPCPFCAGKDRFRVKPGFGDSGWAFCRNCNPAPGWDGIELVRLIKGCSYVEACDSLGIEPKRKFNSYSAKRICYKPKHIAQSSASNIDFSTPVTLNVPSFKWQNAADSFFASCKKITPQAKKALFDERGINPEHWQTCGLGFNPQDIWLDRLEWGIEPEIDSQGKAHNKIFIPSGIVICMRRKSGIMGMMVHKPKFMRREGERKSHVIKGSSQAIYAVGNSGPILVFESPLDAALAWSTYKSSGQDLIALATIGSSKTLDVEADAFVRDADALYFCRDMDDAGFKAWEKFVFTYNQAISLRLMPGVKDLGDLHIACQNNPNFPSPLRWLQHMIKWADSYRKENGC